MASDIKHPSWLPRVLRPTPPRLRLARAFTGQRFGDDLPRAERIPGFLHADQAAALCHAAAICPDGPIVEIGSFKGKSTVFLGRGMKRSNSLHAIDPHISTSLGSRRDRAAARETGTDGAPPETSWRTFNEILDTWKLTDRVHVIRGYSHEVRADWSEAIAMLWVDGDHSYEAVRRDIEDWLPLVVPGGFAAFHDTHASYGEDHTGSVRRAITDAALPTSGEFETYLELRNAWIFRRTTSPHPQTPVTDP